MWWRWCWGKIHAYRSLIVQGLMGAIPVVERQIPGNPLARFSRAGIVVQIYLLVFHTPPQTLCENVVECSPSAIHTDMHPSVLQALRVLWTGEMAALIAIPDLRRCCGQRLVDRVEHKRHFERVVERPTYHVPGIPIQDGNQIHPPLAQADIRDVDAPDVIREAGLHPTQEIRVNLMVQPSPAEIRPGIDCRDAHLLHVMAHRVSRQCAEFWLKQHLDFARTIERVRGIQLVDPMLDRDLAWRGRNRSIVQAGAAHME